MARQGETGCGCLTLIVIGVVIGVCFQNTGAGIVSAVVAAIIIGYFARPKRCEICGNILKRSAYIWKMGRKKRRVCPRCNSALEKEASREAIRRLRGN